MSNTQATQGNREMSKQETLDQFDLCQFVELCIVLKDVARGSNNLQNQLDT